MVHMDLRDSSFVSNPDLNIELWLASSILLMFNVNFYISRPIVFHNLLFMCTFYTIQIFATFKASDLECLTIYDHEKTHILSQEQ